MAPSARPPAPPGRRTSPGPRAPHPPSPSGGVRLALDVGTSSIKALVLGPEGERLAAVRAPSPPLQSWEGRQVQDAEALAAVAAQVLAEAIDAARAHPADPQLRTAVHAALGGGAGPAPTVALTAQRDTLLLADASGAPATPLLSWRERPYLDDPRRRARLLASPWGTTRAPGDPPTGVTRAVDPSRAEGPWPAGGRATRGVRPLTLEGWLVGRSWPEGVNLRYVGGDKNCEYIALGARAPGGLAKGAGADGSAPHHEVPVLALSLGSAISAGVWCPVRPSLDDLPPGVVVSPAPGGGAPGGEASDGLRTDAGWHLETGILSGLAGRFAAAERFGIAPWPGDLPLPGAPGLPDPDPLRVVPWFGGALDDLAAEPEIVGEEPSTLQRDPLAPARLARAWARGVADELARLVPRLAASLPDPPAESAEGDERDGVTRRPWTGGPIRVGGGGAADPAWGVILPAALGCPVVCVSDPFLGCLGAIEAFVAGEAVRQRQGAGDSRTRSPTSAEP